MKDTLNILHISTATTWRGGERQIAILMSGLCEKGVQQVLLCPKSSPLETYCKQHNLSCSSLPKGHGISINWIKKITKICIDRNISHIHTHDSKSHTYSTLATICKKHTPLIFVSRRVIFPIKNTFFTKYKYQHRRLKNIICISKAVENVVKNSIDNKDTSVVYDTIPDKETIIKTPDTTNENIQSIILEEKYPNTKGQKKIGYVAALSSEKDHITFLNTANIILQKYPNYYFFIIGEGSERKNIEQFIINNNLSKNIFLTGFIKNIDNTIKQLDLLLFTSKSEGLGSTILDFFNAKIPVVATKCGGIEEVVLHKKTGLLADIGDAEGLAEMVDHVFSQPKLKSELTKNAYELLNKKFCKTSYINNTLEVYNKYYKNNIVDFNGLTAIIPTYNEGKHIERAIKSVLFADEIIIIDSFSTDKTVEIAQQYPVKILKRPFDNFSSQKNYALNLSTHNWILFIDADEELPTKLQHDIPEILNKNKTHSAYIFKLDYYFQNRLMKFGGFQSKKVIRLFNKKDCQFNGNFVHESPTINGSIGIIETPIKHHDLYNLKHFIDKQKHYAKLKALQNFNPNKKLNPIFKYLKAGFRFFVHYVIRLGIFDGKSGYKFAKIQAKGVLINFNFLKQYHLMSKDLNLAIKTLQKGETILYPTDTVWGIGCDATNEKAIKKIFEIKNRDESKNLIILVNSLEMLNQILEDVPQKSYELLSDKNTPTTIIYHNPKNIASNLIANDNTIAIRLVNDDFCHLLIQLFGKPIVSTSANISGHNTPQKFDEISHNILNKVDCTVKWRQNENTLNTPSKILKINLDNSIDIIR